ncbi:MAG: ribonuclease P protein component [Candidatus Gracilibacteria bacterium]|jgi:ribonuclease P protein component|nr:ribonuclease P protein component [Candidatus Gracilibacteria bacterium]
MISKKFRLKEREVKRALQKGKPFFAYNLVLNYCANKLPHNRFAIVISKKSSKKAVDRNFFRRRFYDKTQKFIGKNKENKYYDFVFVIKTKYKIDKKNTKIIEEFNRDIDFLFKKIFNNYKKNER